MPSNGIYVTKTHGLFYWDGYRAKFWPAKQAPSECSEKWRATFVFIKMGVVPFRVDPHGATASARLGTASQGQAFWGCDSAYDVCRCKHTHLDIYIYMYISVFVDKIVYVCYIYIYM